MSDVPFTAGEMARLQAALGVPAAAPDPVAADLIVVAVAENIARAEDARWEGLGP